MQTIPITTITFPEIKLQTRDAHKLRGYFGDLFRVHSPLLHNHFEDGTLRYAYPLIQYKITSHIPMLIGINEGAKLLTELFLKIKEFDIEGHIYPVLSKHIKAENVHIGLGDDLYNYVFSTNWMALNQKNFEIYLRLDEKGRYELLKKIAISNVLTFYKGVGVFLNPEQRILLQLEVKEKNTNFKNKKMLSFAGSFTTNAVLPDNIGLGKSPARGFGSILQITNNK